MAATPTEVIAAAKAIINTESKWCQGANARRANGTPCAIYSPDAVAFDLYGAVLKAVYDLSAGLGVFHLVYTQLRTNIPPEYKNRDIDSYNDDVEYSLAFAIFDGGVPESDILGTSLGDEVVTHLSDNIATGS